MLWYECSEMLCQLINAWNTGILNNEEVEKSYYLWETEENWEVEIESVGIRKKKEISGEKIVVRVAEK